MKTSRLGILVLLVIALMAAFAAISCERKVTIGRPVLGQEEAEKDGDRHNPEFKETIFQKPPPFYHGKMPLAWIVEKSRNSGLVIAYSFVNSEPSWGTGFIYERIGVSEEGHIGPEGARTHGTGGTLLAEAKFNRTIPGEGLEIEEFHYNPAGAITFYCKSLIDTRTGFKVREREIQGRKEAEYYFIWPVGDPSLADD